MCRILYTRMALLGVMMQPHCMQRQHVKDASMRVDTNLKVSLQHVISVLSFTIYASNTSMKHTPARVRPCDETI